jgi:DNA-3-methyladenine glycosylase
MSRRRSRRLALTKPRSKTAPRARSQRLGLAPLRASFYDRPTERVARDLLGRILESTIDGIRCRARIVETEAYLGEHDSACHAAVGRTTRTEVLYWAPGTAYVYLIYGMYWCANAVTRREGLPSAVLIRAAEPLEGLETMRRRRGRPMRDVDLTSGPGRLCQALGLTGAHHGASLVTSAVRILEGAPVRRSEIAVTPRVGMGVAARDATHWPLRFIVRGNPYVSARAETARWIAAQKTENRRLKTAGE